MKRITRCWLSRRWPSPHHPSSPRQALTMCLLGAFRSEPHVSEAFKVCILRPQGRLKRLGRGEVFEPG
jgi:hypothetical protein